MRLENSKTPRLNRPIYGFTLIELLVVISIIGILATLIMANFNAARERARDAQRKADLRNIQTALRVYYNDTRRYPCEETSGTPSRIRACDANAACGSVAICAWNAAWAVGTRTYMRSLPGDPSPSRSYRYDQVNNDDYTLAACLENASDEDCAGNAAWCAAGTGCIYQVRP
jgi:general secretion pathway protein G